MDIEPQSKQAAAEASQATSKAVARARELVVTDPASYDEASTLLSNIKVAQKLVREKKDAVLKPLNEALREYRSMFKGPEDEIAQAETIIKGKLLEYSRKAREAEAKLQARVDRDTMKPATALRKMDEIAVTNTDKVQIKKIKRVRVKDVSKVELVILKDPRVIEAIERAGRIQALAAFERGVQLPGFEVYEDETVAAS